MKIIPCIANTLFLVLLTSFLLLPFKPVYSVATCSGEICNTIPSQYLQQIKELDLQFKIQYLDVLLDSMGKASAMANTGTGLIGLGALNKYQIGAGGTVSYLTNKSVELAYKDTVVRRLPNAGFSITPGVSFGLNLGWALEKGGGLDLFLKEWDDPDEEADSDKEEEENVYPTLLHRFNFYAHGMSFNSNMSDYKSIQPKNFGTDGTLSINQYGFDLRYLMVTPGLDHGFFRFMGINIGIGYHRLKNDLNLTSTKEGNAGFKVGPYLGSWVGNTNLNYEMTTVSIPVDFRTGFLFFKFMTFFFGAGFAKHDIDGSVSLTRGGPLRLSIDPNFSNTANSLTPAQFQTIQEAVKREGYLDIRVQSQEKFGFSNGYGILGFEFAMGPLQFLTEAIFFGKSGSGSLGIKVNF